MNQEKKYAVHETLLHFESIINIYMPILIISMSLLSTMFIMC